MKKAILTISLFSLVMILTSFTTPETSTNDNNVTIGTSNIRGAQATGGNVKLDIRGAQATGGNVKLDIRGAQATGGNVKLDIRGAQATGGNVKLD
jgi:hypothetical protein